MLGRKERKGRRERIQKRKGEENGGKERKRVKNGEKQRRKDGSGKKGWKDYERKRREVEVRRKESW